MTSPGRLQTPHNLRLFPKDRGAEAYAVTGIAARCDWVLLSDRAAPRLHLHRNVPTPAPRHVFVSLRDPFHALAHFATSILPRLQMPFVLVTGSEDVTLPRQTDRRWRAWNAAEQGHIRAILDHPLLMRWFAENLSDDDDPRFAPLPTGLVFPDGPPAGGVALPAVPPLASRPLRMLIGHRVRPGPQWELRRQVSARGRNAWAPFCTLLSEEVTEAAFARQMQGHAFVLCAEGGGLDPSPKAWSAILHGAIPILRATATGRGYAELPVALTEDWLSASITPDRLAAWHAQFAPVQDSPARRADVLKRLGLEHWWAKIAACAPQGL